MRSRLLDGLRVVDLARGAAADCARILGSLGAEVVRIDTPADLAWAAGHPWRETSWRLRNGGKHLMTLDYGLADGRAILQRLLNASDVLIESFDPAQRGALRLTPADLAETNPALVPVSITTFGAQGPRAHWAGYNHQGPRSLPSVLDAPTQTLWSRTPTPLHRPSRRSDGVRGVLVRGLIPPAVAAVRPGA